jgi:EmrB/QacA subfamily drug resistance transporter
VISFGKAPCDEGLIRAGVSAGSGTRGTWVLAATILGSSMAFIDGSVVNIALPAIQADMASTVAGLQWVVNGYMLMLGALILVGGAAGDRFGRRRVFALGIVVFMLASLACAAAPTIPLLVAARALQGIGGALLVPSSLSLISASFTQADRGRAIGTWAGVSALTTALGPVLGGWLVDELSWRVIFLINLPIAAAALAVTLRHVPESRDDRVDGGIDWLGAALATVGLAGTVYGLTAASEAGWSNPAVLGALGGGLLLLAAFVWVEGRAGYPMMPLHLFRSRAFSGANGMTLLLYFALGGVMFLLPFNLIGVQGFSATAAGASFLPFTVVLGGLSRWSGGLVDRYGARGPLTIGPVIVAAGFGMFAIPGTAAFYWTTFFPAMLVVGLGMAISIAPLTTTVMGAVDDRHAGTASGVNNASARIAGMLAVAIMGAATVAVFGDFLQHRLVALALPPDVEVALMAEVPRLGEAQVPAGVQGDLRVSLQGVLDDAFVASFRVAMLLAAVSALLSAACAALTIRSSAARA